MLVKLLVAALAFGALSVQAAPSHPSASCLSACTQTSGVCGVSCATSCASSLSTRCLDVCKQSCELAHSTCQQACAFEAAHAHASSKHSKHHSHHHMDNKDDQEPSWVSRPVSEAVYQREFTAFVNKYSKTYAHDEFPLRYNIFKANWNKIRHHNMGNHSYSMSVNEFADMSFEEFHQKMTGYNRRGNAYSRSQNSEGPHEDVSAPAASIDWRAKGAVTEPKNQAQCGSCWSFSTTGSVEGAHAIKSGKLVSLSEQQLMDCSTAEGNNGCNGGLMDNAFEWIIKNKGITSEEAYPYTAADGTCQSGKPIAATISSFVDVKTEDEKALLQAVNIGPVSIAIEADQQVFQFYSGGVLSGSGCGTALDHGVLIVGYGTEDGKDYWIVKNSWGASWGEKGYIRLQRNTNECGLATEPSYPVV